MLRQIITSAVNALTGAGVPQVYSSFDSIPVERKSRGIFTVVSIGAFESSTPVYSAYTMYLPFKAEIVINITAPEKWSMDKLYTYFDSTTAPALTSLAGMTSRISGITIKHDSNIDRFVLSVKLGVSGITKIERGSANELND